ncbi:putative Oligopeptide transporter 6 [Seiridium cardinale]
MVPVGLGIGAGLVGAHRVSVHVVPKVRGFSVEEINLPQFIKYAGCIPYNQSQTFVVFECPLLAPTESSDTLRWVEEGYVAIARKHVNVYSQWTDT